MHLLPKCTGSCGRAGDYSKLINISLNSHPKLAFLTNWVKSRISIFAMRVFSPILFLPGNTVHSGSSVQCSV